MPHRRGRFVYFPSSARRCPAAPPKETQYALPIGIWLLVRVRLLLLVRIRLLLRISRRRISGLLIVARRRLLIIARRRRRGRDTADRPDSAADQCTRRRAAAAAGDRPDGSAGAGAQKRAADGPLARVVRIGAGGERQYQAKAQYKWPRAA